MICARCLCDIEWAAISLSVFRDTDELTTAPKAPNSVVSRQARVLANVYRCPHEKLGNLGKIQIDTASADTIAVACVGGLAVYDGYASSLLARNTGAAHGVHA